MSATYDLHSAAHFTDPYPTYEQMRRDDPVYFDPAYAMWLLTRYKDVHALSRSRITSVARVDHLLAGASQEVAGQAEVVRRFLSDWLVFSDPPRHTILRKLQTHAFLPRRIAALEAYIRELVDATLDGLEGSGHIDIIRDVSIPVPANVIAHMLGVPSADVEAFKSWTAAVFRVPAFVGDRDENILAAYDGIVSLDGFFRDLIAFRRKTPSDDLLCALVQAQADGQFLGEEELVSTCALLLLAGHETTTHLIGNGIIALLRHPAELKRLRENPELIDSAVEEFQRYDSPSGMLSRILTEDMEISGQVVPAGQVVSGVVWAANRDPETFDDPDRFDVTRNDSRHLGFGGGPHLCLGAALARLETKIAVGALLTRFPNLQLADDNLVWMPSIAIRGVQSLPVTV